MFHPDIIIDSHIHWFDYNAFQQFQKSIKQTEAVLKHHIRSRTDMTQFKGPKEDQNFGKTWINEFDRVGVTKGAMLADKISWPNLANAITEFKGRFIGIANINPLAGINTASYDIEEAVKKYGFKGIKLYPVMGRYHLFDDRVRPTLEKCAELKIPIIVHFGVSIGVQADMRYANPLDLQPVARDYPDLNFIIAHFGAGYFRESLMLLYQTNNVNLDTSGSNIWRKYQPVKLSVKELFERAIDAGGVDRILFGTDSSFFPRGYRKNILEEQLDAANDLLSSRNEFIEIFGGNANRVFSLKD